MLLDGVGYHGDLTYSDSIGHINGVAPIEVGVRDIRYFDAFFCPAISISRSYAMMMHPLHQNTAPFGIFPPGAIQELLRL